MKVSFNVKLQVKDLYRFNMYQAYTGIQGWISIILGILTFVMAGVTFGEKSFEYTFLYIVIGLLFWFYMPISFWLRAKTTLKTNEVLAGELHYEVSEEQIHVTQKEESGELPWDAIYKLVSNKHQILIYTNRINAYIIPLEQIGESYAGFKEIAEKKLEKFRLKLRA